MDRSESLDNWNHSCGSLCDVGIVLYNSISKIPDSPDAMLIF